MSQATSPQNPTLFPTFVTQDTPSPVFPTPSAIDGQAPEGYEGNQTFNFQSLSAAGAAPWVSGGTYAAGAYVTSVGLFYVNLTGTNTTTAPASDTTNWLEVFNYTVGVGTPTAVETTVGPNIPDLAFPAPPVTPAGTLSGTPTATGTWLPSFGSAAKLPVYASGTTYVKNAVVGFTLAVSAWVSGTTYAVGNLVSYANGSGQIAVYISLVSSNTGNVPANFGSGNESAENSTFWQPVALTEPTAGNWTVGFQSAAAGNVGNTPAANSTHWTVVPEQNALALTREGGPLTFPAQTYPSGTETETWTTSGAFGGTGTSVLQRTDFSSQVASVSLSATTLSFAHTTTGTSTATVKDVRGTTVTPGTIVPGDGLIPNIVVSSSTPATATVAVVQSTGVVTVTGVAAGTTTITVSCGGRTATIAVTCS